MKHPSDTRTAVARPMAACALKAAGLVISGRLHRRPARVGARVALPDGRRFTVYRETTCDDPGADPEVTLAVWFRLRAVPPGGRRRQWLFERESILNTVLYAGCPGYAAKLWMIDRPTGMYAGLYAWRGRSAAEDYARYITAVLGPLSVPGSVGFQIVDLPLEPYLRTAVIEAPSSPRADGTGGAAALEGAGLILVTVAGAPLLRRRYNRWGATPDETTMALPGDDLVPRPDMTSTRALTIDAPPEAVWPWLAQIGQGRGGLYSYDVLENLVGCDLHSADRILAAHQDVAAGDEIRLGPEGYPAYRVVTAETPHTLVLAGAGPDGSEADGAVTSSWAWRVGPLDGGRTRLIARQRLAFPRRQWLLWHLVEPVGFVMERRMLLGLRARAETSRR